MRLETRLREYRQAKGLDQAALAALVGVRRETIGRLEKGQYNPSLKLAMDLAQVPYVQYSVYELTRALVSKLLRGFAHAHGGEPDLPRIR